MSTLNGKTIGAAASATMLALAGVATVAPAVAQASDVTADAPQAAAAQSAEAGAAASGVVSAAVVEGEFAFSQDVVTPNATLSSVFAKAAAALCQSAAGELSEATAAAAPIAVGGDVENAYTATVAEMAGADGATSFVMGCTCATNVVCGGAIANADVEGVALESVLAQAQTAQN